ncbi:20037_t:CDS:2 [Rhizophagus irregularis]|nr:20037_t:CDS:2 [Rhizophagus irregularis]
MALSDIIQDFENLLENGDPYDVIIKSSDDPLKEFKAHSTILRARAPYFSTALDTNKIQDGVHYFEESSIHSTVWPVILRYLYTGQFDFNEQQFSELKNLLEAADQLGLEKLMDSIKLPPKETINGNGTTTKQDKFFTEFQKNLPNNPIWNSATYGPCFGDGDLWCVENLSRDEQCSSNSKSYRQGICDTIIKSLTGESSSNDEKRWSSTTFGLGASFSSTNSNDIWGNEWNLTNNVTTSSPTTLTNFDDNIRFNVDEYEVFRISRTDTYKSINQRKFRRGKKRLTLVEKYHTAVSDSD